MGILLCTVAAATSANLQARFRACTFCEHFNCATLGPQWGAEPFWDCDVAGRPTQDACKVDPSSTDRAVWTVSQVSSANPAGVKCNTCTVGVGVCNTSSTHDQLSATQKLGICAVLCKDVAMC